MKKILFLSSYVFCFIFLFNGCKKDSSVTGPQGPAGPSYKGSFIGHVSLFDQYGTKLFTKLNKVDVSIDGSGMSTTTDSTGKFTFSNLNTGVYSLTYTDSGFGAFKVQNVQLLAGTNTRDAKLYMIPNFNMNSPLVVVDTISVSNKDTTMNVKLRGTIGPDSKSRTLIVFVGNTSATSADPSTYLLTYTKTIAVSPNTTSFSLLIPDYELNSALLTKGATAYFAVYGEATGTSTYEDLSTGRTVYTAISSTAVTASHVMP